MQMAYDREMTKHFSTTFLMPLLLTTLAFSATGCKQGSKDADKILDAQNCLNNIPQGFADECVSKVEGIESEAAYLIRCVGEFVDEGYGSSNKIVTAITNLESQGEGSAGSTAMIATLAFTAGASEALNKASAKLAFTYCTESKSKGLIFLSGLAQTSTVLASLSAGLDLSDPSSLTGANLQAAMTALSGNPEAQAAVGASIVSIYETNCTNNQTTTGSYCEQFGSAVDAVPGGTSNPTGIGQQIMLCYTNPATPGCSGF